MTSQSNNVQVSKSILNNSTAKACFSFGKAPRSPKESKHKYDAWYSVMRSMINPPCSATGPLSLALARRLTSTLRSLAPRLKNMINLLILIKMSKKDVHSESAGKILKQFQCFTKRKILVQANITANWNSLRKLMPWGVETDSQQSSNRHIIQALANVRKF